MTSLSRRLPVDLRAVARAFGLPGRFLDGAPIGSGHINDTFAVRMDRSGRTEGYILQRINDRVFRDVPALMENVHRVTAHVAARTSGPDATRRSLTLVPAADGGACHRDPDGAHWRCYVRIERAKCHDLVENPEQARETARCFGEFQRLLADLPGGRLNETIPHFHDTPRRLAALERAAAADSHGRAASSRAEIEFALARAPVTRVLTDLASRGEIPERIAHNDTKANNVLLDEATGKGLCAIDLDTVMPGLSLYDFGDMVRSATNAAAEDERDPDKVAMRMPVYEGILSGYLSSAGALLNSAERAHLAFSGKLLTLEQGIRFLTDHLEGDSYYKIRYPGYNLDRCRNQFALVRSIEAQEVAMQALADKIGGPT